MVMERVIAVWPGLEARSGIGVAFEKRTLRSRLDQRIGAALQHQRRAGDRNAAVEDKRGNALGKQIRIVAAEHRGELLLRRSERQHLRARRSTINAAGAHAGVADGGVCREQPAIAVAPQPNPLTRRAHQSKIDEAAQTACNVLIGEDASSSLLALPGTIYQETRDPSRAQRFRHRAIGRGPASHAPNTITLAGVRSSIG